MAGNVVFCTLAGYGLAKFRFPGDRLVLLAILSTLMLPLEVTLVPTFLVIHKFDWLNTYQGITGPLLIDAFGVFLMRQSILSIPVDYIEAARMGRCRRTPYPLAGYPAAVLAGARDPDNFFFPGELGPVPVASDRSLASQLPYLPACRCCSSRAFPASVQKPPYHSTLIPGTRCKMEIVTSRACGRLSVGSSAQPMALFRNPGDSR